MSEIKRNDSSSTEDSAEETDWAAAKAFFDNLKTQKPRPVSVLVKRLICFKPVCLLVSRKVSYTVAHTHTGFVPQSSLALSDLSCFISPFHPTTAKTQVCRHHRGLLAHSLQHGGREEDLWGRRGGKLRVSSGETWKRASETWSCFPLR